VEYAKRPIRHKLHNFWAIKYTNITYTERSIADINIKCPSRASEERVAGEALIQIHMHELMKQVAFGAEAKGRSHTL